MGLLIYIALIIIYTVIKLKMRRKSAKCKSHTCLVGKTVIVTGANSGIGYETALDFAKRGARVILACRNQKKADAARTTIVKETKNENVVVKIIDLASFESVRAFAKEINEKEERLDILVNNAGAHALGAKKSVDGHLLLMQVNYFSSFLLSLLLTNLLKKSGSSRIVNVASVAANSASKFNVSRIDEHVLNIVDYANSKLCLILFTMELAKKLRGSGVTTYSLHPGISYKISNEFKSVKTCILRFFLSFYGKTCEEGAQTTIYCSVANGIETYNGQHFQDCRRIESYRTASDSRLAEELWDKTEDIVGMKFDEI